MLLLLLPLSLLDQDGHYEDTIMSTLLVCRPCEEHKICGCIIMFDRHCHSTLPQRDFPKAKFMQ